MVARQPTRPTGHGRRGMLWQHRVGGRSRLPEGKGAVVDEHDEESFLAPQARRTPGRARGLAREQR
ncbi:MAG TPA: hypothetical protein VMU95_32540, partial [Trebonia sp.]|nr:hypothetical protein [Trebonia sp.]